MIHAGNNFSDKGGPINPIGSARALHQRLLMRFREERGRVQIDATVTSRVTNLGMPNDYIDVLKVLFQSAFLEDDFEMTRLKLLVAVPNLFEVLAGLLDPKLSGFISKPTLRGLIADLGLTLSWEDTAIFVAQSRRGDQSGASTHGLSLAELARLVWPPNSIGGEYLEGDEIGDVASAVYITNSTIGCP